MWNLFNTICIVLVAGAGVMFAMWVYSEIEHIKNKVGNLR